MNKPPIAPRRPSPRTLHGITVEDDYAWLKDEKWQEVLRDPSLLDPDIRAYLEAENQYTETLLAPTQDLQKVLVAEMRGRIKEDDSGVPTPDGPFAYLWKFREGGQHEQIGRTARNGGEMQTVLDGDALAKASDYFKFGGTRHSPNHQLVAWSADLRGSEFFTLRVRRWDTGEDLPDTLEQTGGRIVWGRDSSFFYYVQVDDNHRPLKVFRHRLGTPQADDVLVYEEKDVGWFTHIEESPSGRFCVIAGGDHDTTEQHLIDLSIPDATPAPDHAATERRSLQRRGSRRGAVHPHQRGRRHRLPHRHRTARRMPGRANWQELIPHRPGVYILGMELFAGHLVRLERSNALPSIVIRELDRGGEHVIAFDEAAYSLDMAGGFEFDTTTLRFVYSSMTTPAEVYDYDMASRERTLRKRQQIPSGHDPADYATTRILASVARWRRSTGVDPASP